MTRLRLAHLSDLHLDPAALPPPGFAAWCGKRALSRLSWVRGRGELQQRRVLEAAVADARALAPTHWLISGDVVNFSLPAEFAQAADWFAALDDAARVSVIPGNHDALVPVPVEQGLGRWRSWMAGAAARHEFPYRRPLADGVVLIGLSTALPTAPGLASGELGAAQLAKLADLLADTRGAFRIVALHHPPAEGVVSTRKALRDRAAFREVLATHGAELVLHGHARDAQFTPLRGPAGPIACLGLPSVSAIPNPKDEGGRWSLIEVERVAGAWRVAVAIRRYDPSRAAFARGGAYRLAIPAQ